MTLSVHPLEQTQQDIPPPSVPDMMDTTSITTTTPTMAAQTPSPTTSSPPPRPQQRAYSVTAMPSELQKSVMRHQEAEHQEKLRHNQPWWQYYYQLYHYHLPPGRKPTVFGPYLLLQTLGEGEFGKVKFGIEVKTGQEVAIKLIRKDSIDSASRMTKVEREISVLRVLRHPNIVQLFDVIETEKYIGIILQCATGGELFDYILAHRYLKERDASRLFAQLISGVHYMHQKHIVHRDLKLENLLLDKHRNVLITDFGFANQFASPQNDLMSTSCGSPCYAAPELVMNQGVYVGPAVDIWSCGVILFAMLCGYLPYDDDPANPESYNINLLYKYILNTPLIFPDYISDEACDLMSLMLVPDPEKRCTMDAIMNHPWLSPHKHLFVNIYDNGEDQVVPSQQEEKAAKTDDVPMPETVRPDTTTASVSEHPEGITRIEEKEEERDVDIPEEKEDKISEEEEEEAVVPLNTAMDQIMEEPQQDTAHKDTPMQDISTLELPPLTVPHDSKEPAETTKDAQTTAVDQAAADDQAVPAVTKVESPPSPLPTISESQIRPKSTVSSSTEKVLHFLSGHSNTPKVGNTNEKRTRHMSLATEAPSHSILQAKFLSSMNQRKASSQQTTLQPASPTPNTSASTPHPSKKPPSNNKRQVRLSTITPPPASHSNNNTSDRGTRRKTLSLLVNSMTDNSKIPFARRQSNARTTTPPIPEPERAPMIPSVSEHTIHQKEEKHRSAGKKLMDWFKKKPLSTMNRSTNGSSDTMSHSDRLSSGFSESQSSVVVDAKLRTHHGAVDQEALTSRAPAQVFLEVKQALKSLGLEYKRDGGEYKLKCSRPKRAVTEKRKSGLPSHSNGYNGNPPFRMLMRRSSAHQSTVAAVSSDNKTSDKIPAIYGDPNVDPGEEVRFSVELCKIKNLPGLYIVDMRRMRGNVWAYKFIYRTLLDTLKLGGKSGYLNTDKETTTTTTTNAAADTAADTTAAPADTTISEDTHVDDTTSHHRMSTASSSGNTSSSLLDDPPHTPSPPISSSSKQSQMVAA